MPTLDYYTVTFGRKIRCENWHSVVVLILFNSDSSRMVGVESRWGPSGGEAAAWGLTKAVESRVSAVPRAARGDFCSCERLGSSSGTWD